jgi:hypothetical protein
MPRSNNMNRLCLAMVLALFAASEAVTCRMAAASVLQELNEADPAPPLLRSLPNNSRPTYRGPAFWEPYQVPPELPQLVNGNLAKDSSDPLFRRVFIEFVAEFGDSCSNYLSAGYKKYRVKRDDGRLSQEILRVDAALASSYVEYWNTMGAWGTADFLNARLKNDPSRVFSPSFFVPQIFSALGCANPVIWQLRENLLRIANGKEQVMAKPSYEWLRAVVDPRTGLIWSSHDALWNIFHSKRHSREEASVFCEALVIGKLKDWRLPVIQELEGLFDKTAPSSRCDSGERPTSCHIRLGITLSIFRIWSATPAPRGSSNSLVQFFNTGGNLGLGDSDNYMSSTLCVHDPLE